MNRLPAALATLLILPLVATACQGNASHGGAAKVAPTLAKVGQPAPAFNEPTAAGSTLSLDSLHGKAVYLNFFASWCPPCNDEAPEVNAVQQEFASRGFQVVGVDVLDSTSKAQQFISRYHLSYPAVVDDGTLRQAYKVTYGLPVHVFIDRTGVVRKMEIGQLSKAQMEADAKLVL